jgi:hypothetical protein
MEDNPVKFLFKGLVKVLGIVPDPVDADIYLPYHRLALPGQVKSDDIGIVIMLQVGFIHLQQGLVRTKDIVHCNERLPLPAKEGGNELFEPAPLFEGESRIRKVEPDAGI